MLAASKCPLMAKFRPRNTSSTPPTGGVSRYVGRPPRGAAYAPGSGATQLPLPASRLLRSRLGHHPLPHHYRWPCHRGPFHLGRRCGHHRLNLLFQHGPFVSVRRALDAVVRLAANRRQQPDDDVRSGRYQRIPHSGRRHNRLPDREAVLWHSAHMGWHRNEDNCDSEAVA